MNPWLIKSSRADEPDMPDMEILEEAALAMAQATLQNAITQSGLTRAELARRLSRPRSFISRMLSGDHNLTVKTMARTLAACGREVRFGSEPLVWNWPQYKHPFKVIPGGPSGTSELDVAALNEHAVAA